MTDTLTILTAARNIITDPAMWYQGDYTASGEWNTDEPCCAEGAIKRAAHCRSAYSYNAVTYIAAFTPNHMGIHRFNDADDTTHADVMAVFDRAIAALEVKP